MIYHLTVFFLIIIILSLPVTAIFVPFMQVLRQILLNARSRRNKVSSGWPSCLIMRSTARL